MRFKPLRLRLELHGLKVCELSHLANWRTNGKTNNQIIVWYTGIYIVKQVKQYDWLWVHELKHYWKIEVCSRAGHVSEVLVSKQKVNKANEFVSFNFKKFVGNYYIRVPKEAFL